MTNNEAIEAKPHGFSNAHELLILLAAFLLIALLTGIGGYLLGVRTSRAISQPTPRGVSQPSPISSCPPSPTSFVKSTPTIPLMPTAAPQLTENWKAYTNTQWGVSFKYPETWFPQELQGWNPPGESVSFYLNGVTPDTDQGGDMPTNAELNVEISSHTQQTNDQFVSDAPQTPGYQKILDVSGRPAIETKISGFKQYYVKLSKARTLILSPYTKEGDEGLDVIVSSIKFANE